MAFQGRRAAFAQLLARAAVLGQVFDRRWHNDAQQEVGAAARHD